MKPGTRFNYFNMKLINNIFIFCEKLILTKNYHLSISYYKSILFLKGYYNFRNLLSLFLLAFICFQIQLFFNFKQYLSTYPLLAYFFLLILLITLPYLGIGIKTLLVEFNVLKKFVHKSDKKLYSLIKKEKKIRSISKSKSINIVEKLELSQKKHTGNIIRGLVKLIALQNQNMEHNDILNASKFIVKKLFSNINEKLCYTDIKDINHIEFHHHCIVDFSLLLYKNNLLNYKYPASISIPLSTHFPKKYNTGFSQKNIYDLIRKRNNKPLTFKKKMSERALLSHMRNQKTSIKTQSKQKNKQLITK